MNRSLWFDVCWLSYITIVEFTSFISEMQYSRSKLKYYIINSLLKRRECNYTLQIQEWIFGLGPCRHQNALPLAGSSKAIKFPLHRNRSVSTMTLPHPANKIIPEEDTCSAWDLAHLQVGSRIGFVFFFNFVFSFL